ncbi:hypothetical protein SAMN04488020_10962 [Palleronia marisminoris]|uniref:hypothetical protein n=1 Tax=Palleronia marisminoris TaxID=315423 RepID=UPI0008E3C412|nr:hypothetical protein [Palleronia marisminoris]SFH27537.1 hypothetical protein SAMN04488020_10962 [Palleronia marisminoris]
MREHVWKVIALLIFVAILWGVYELIGILPREVGLTLLAVLFVWSVCFLVAAWERRHRRRRPRRWSEVLS